MSKERLPKLTVSDALSRLGQPNGQRSPNKLYEYSLTDIYNAVSGEKGPQTIFDEALYQVDHFASQAENIVNGKLNQVNSQINQLRTSLANDQQRDEFDALVKAYERSKRGLLGAAIRHHAFEKTDTEVEGNIIKSVANPDRPYLRYLAGMHIGDRAHNSIQRQREIFSQQHPIPAIAEAQPIEAPPLPEHRELSFTAKLGRRFLSFAGGSEKVRQLLRPLSIPEPVQPMPATSQEDVIAKAPPITAAKLGRAFLSLNGGSKAVVELLARDVARAS